MEFDDLKKAWQKADSKIDPLNDRDIEDKIKTIIATKTQLKKSFIMEMVAASLTLAFFLIVFLFAESMEPYFYKLLVIVLVGSIPPALRFHLSIGIMENMYFTQNIGNNLMVVIRHFKKSVQIYYLSLVLTLIALVSMTLLDGFFLSLPTSFQIGVMGYYLIVFLLIYFWIRRQYVQKMKKLSVLQRTIKEE